MSLTPMVYLAMLLVLAIVTARLARAMRSMHKGRNGIFQQLGDWLAGVVGAIFRNVLEQDQYIFVSSSNSFRKRYSPLLACRMP